MTSPDLDALAALLAEHRRDHNGNYCWCPCLEALPELIEAAQREAVLREALAVLVHEVDPSALGTAVATRTFSGSMGLALERARSLLHDNAGVAARAALPAEGTEERVP